MTVVGGLFAINRFSLYDQPITYPSMFELLLIVLNDGDAEWLMMSRHSQMVEPPVPSASDSFGRTKPVSDSFGDWFWGKRVITSTFKGSTFKVYKTKG